MKNFFPIAAETHPLRKKALGQERYRTTSIVLSKYVYEFITSVVHVNEKKKYNSSQGVTSASLEQ